MTAIKRPLPRRRILRGMMGGAAVTVGLPFLDCFLNTSGTALASGTELPVVFGSWFQGLGLSPGLWEPKVVGANYEMNQHLAPLAPFKSKINIFSGLKIFTDGRPVMPHATGPAAILLGDVRSDPRLASLDSLIADHIGQNTRFRSLEVTCDGEKQSLSRRSGTLTNPSEFSPVALYTRIFGPDFVDPNNADFKPNQKMMVRKSVLSSIQDHRTDFVKELGASDKMRMDEYFTSLRELENQLELQLQKPAPLPACSPSAAPEETKLQGMVDEDVMKNHALFAKLLAHAVACGQTRVFNMMLSSAGSALRKSGTSDNFHVLTHEEGADYNLGYQPRVYYFQSLVGVALKMLLSEFEGIKEGNRTLLDRSLILYTTDCSIPRLHTIDNIPVLTAGSANGRVKTGLHINAPGEAITRIGLTMQQAMGMPTAQWGTDSNQTSKPITEILA